MSIKHKISIIFPPLSLKYIINKKLANTLIKIVIKRGSMGNTSKLVRAIDACW